MIFSELHGHTAHFRREGRVIPICADVIGHERGMGVQGAKPLASIALPSGGNPVRNSILAGRLARAGLMSGMI